MTEPRIVAAMGIADRVSRALIAQTGDSDYSLGYRVQYRTGRGSCAFSGLSDFTMATEGLVLMQLLGGSIPDIIVLDELHEKTNYMIILLYYLRRLMSMGHDNFKLILSSATIDPKEFQDYFRSVLNGADFPVVEAEGRAYPIEKRRVKPEDYTLSIIESARAGNNILAFAE